MKKTWKFDKKFQFLNLKFFGNSFSTFCSSLFQRITPPLRGRRKIRPLDRSALSAAKKKGKSSRKKNFADLHFRENCIPEKWRKFERKAYFPLREKNTGPVANLIYAEIRRNKNWQKSFRNRETNFIVSESSSNTITVY